MHRKPMCTYRIVIRDGWWDVSTFAGNTMVGPEAHYAEDAVPEWIRKEVAVLRLVPDDDSIANVGHRVGRAFWLLPKQPTESDIL